MEIAEQHAGEITVVEVKGRIDSNTAKVFGERLTGLIKDGRARLVVDFKQIIYISSAGFRALLVAGKLADETNGTLAPPGGIDWLCVSPKVLPLVVESGDELKLVYPNPRLEPENFDHLAFDHFLLQPLDGPAVAESTQAAVDYCLAHPKWRLSLQTHKQLGIR